MSGDYKGRKACKHIVLVDKDGLPVKNKTVHINQVKHKFLFGCAEMDTYGYLDHAYSKEETERRSILYDKMFDLFNYTTLHFYWSSFEDKSCTKEKMLKAVEFFRKNACHVKGHPLFWHTGIPEWLLEIGGTESVEEIKKLAFQYVADTVTTYKGMIDCWDIINETVVMPGFSKTNPFARLCRSTGRIGLIKELYQLVKGIHPDGKFYLNDYVYTGMDSYEILIDGCLNAGIPIDGIGIQAHMYQGFWGIETLQEVIERFSKFKLPIHFSECTLISGEPMPKKYVDFNDYKIDHWESTKEGEIRQAEEAKILYETLFSSEYVEAITYWNFLDEEDKWLGAPDGFVGLDGELKPIYHAVYDLIKKKWWTQDMITQTSDQGVITVDGFLGDYEIIVDNEKYGFTLDTSNTIEKIQVR